MDDLCRQSALTQLVSMGFEEAQVKDAICICGDNADHVIEYLLSSPSSINNASSASPSDSTSLIVGPISQYSVEHGRSACTCIALCGAIHFLQDPNSLSPAFLQQMVLDGVAAYQQLTYSTEIEHMSAEEVLDQKCPVFLPLQQLPEGIKQGVLSSDETHPLGLKTMLQGCHEQSPANQWTVVLMTKVPETILICLPPSSSLSKQFWVVDSHPQHALQAENAFAKSHITLEDLIQTLQIIFPVTDLGPDVPDMTTMMYNSFDLYLLRC